MYLSSNCILLEPALRTANLLAPEPAPLSLLCGTKGSGRGPQAPVPTLVGWEAGQVSSISHSAELNAQ